MLRLKNMVKGIIWQMVQAVRLGLMSRDLLHALPPQLEMKENPLTCTHGKCRRYGNAHGRFATCLQCGLKWVWNNDLNKWEDRLLKEGQKAGSKGRSTPLQPLPAPSSQTIAASSQAALQATSKSVAKPVRSKTDRRAIGYPREGVWTNFYDMDYKLGHLTESQYLEAFNVMEQDHPFMHTPRNFFEEAFFYDEIYKPDRLKM